MLGLNGLSSKINYAYKYKHIFLSCLLLQNIHMSLVISNIIDRTGLQYYIELRGNVVSKVQADMYNNDIMAK